MRAKSSATDEVVRRVYEKALCRLEAPSDDARARALYRAIARVSAPACTTP
jgi:hypothetical protein